MSSKLQLCCWAGRGGEGISKTRAGSWLLPAHGGAEPVPSGLGGGRGALRSCLGPLVGAALQLYVLRLLLLWRRTAQSS